ncbi:MAG: hypothetical protein H6745_31550 [Deltaproteobacteria bacterium]|nr:hypothetical protein [Deltaproteobacteria bacterium]
MNYAMNRSRDLNAPQAAEQLESAGASRGNELRGMSFAEGEAALSPEAPVQMHAKGGGAPAPAVQMKKKGGELPEEIEALHLKKVKVKCSQADWEKLSGDEQQGVLDLLAAKEKSGTKCTVTIRSNKLVDVSEETVAGLEGDAATNVASMHDGIAPKKSSAGQSGKTIGVNTNEATTVPVEEVKEEPKKVLKEHDETVKAAGSTFDSADYESQDMQQSGVMAILEEAAAKIAEYRAIDPEAKVTVTVVASESHVPNPAAFKEIGSLAAARAANARALAQQHFASVGIDPANIDYAIQNLGANGPAWDPKLGAHNDVYTQHQFVALELHAEVMEEVEEETPDEEKNDQPQPKVDGERISLSVSTKTKSKGSNSYDKKFKKAKKGPRVKKTKYKKPKKYRTISCPTF